MNKFNVFINYIKHQFKAYNRHGIHSPFVYTFLEDVLYADYKNETLNQLHEFKQKLKQDRRLIDIVDLGAGSTINKSNSRPVKDIAKNSSKHSKYGRLFYRMIQHYQPENVLELGTSLGLSTAYFAKANSELSVTTLEGCSNTLKIAKENFDQLRIQNIKCVQGDFNETLEKVLNEIGNVDFVFFDGNHQEEPTLEYFEKCLPHISNKTIFIFDDIHWSEGMMNAWDKIKGHPKTVVTLDLFFLGIVFFDSRLTPQDFLIRF